MFTDSRSIDNRATAASFDTAYQKYAAATDSWFDGTPLSIDNRLAQCNRLAHIARTRVARQGVDAGPLLNLASLEADARALVALRQDLLNGAYDRMDNSPIAGVHVAGTSGPYHEDEDGMAPWEAADKEKGWSKDASCCDKCNCDPCTCDHKKESSLSPADRRFVTLESSRFLADNTDTNDARELATRAMHLAQKVTSTFDVNRSRAVTAAFVARVAEGAYERQRIASAAPRPSVRTASVDSLPPEALFF